MIGVLKSKFIAPAKNLRRLSLLMAIKDVPESSQYEIGKVTNLSSSMVNNYIKSLKDEKLISVAGDTNRTQSYHLTEAGQEILRKDLLSYSAEIVHIYASVKAEITKILTKCYEDGIRTVVLFGAADTAEIVYTSIKDTFIAVLGVVDSNPEKHGSLFNGFKVEHPEIIGTINPDAVVITSFAWQEEIYKQVEQYLNKGIKLIRLSDIN